MGRGGGGEGKGKGRGRGRGGGRGGEREGKGKGRGRGGGEGEELFGVCNNDSRHLHAYRTTNVRDVRNGVGMDECVGMYRLGKQQLSGFYSDR